MLNGKYNAVEARQLPLALVAKIHVGSPQKIFNILH